MHSRLTAGSRGHAATTDRRRMAQGPQRGSSGWFALVARLGRLSLGSVLGDKAETEAALVGVLQQLQAAPSGATGDREGGGSVRRPEPDRTAPTRGRRAGSRPRGVRAAASGASASASPATCGKLT